MIIPATISAILRSYLSLQIVVIWTADVLASLIGLRFAEKYDFSIGPAIALFGGGELVITSLMARF